jgi:hypothetical protein
MEKQFHLLNADFGYAISAVYAVFIWSFVLILA